MEEDADGNIDKSFQTLYSKGYKDVAHLARRMIKRSRHYSISKRYLFRKLRKLQKIYDQFRVNKKITD